MGSRAVLVSCVAAAAIAGFAAGGLTGGLGLFPPSDREPTSDPASAPPRTLASAPAKAGAMDGGTPDAVAAGPSGWAPPTLAASGKPSSDEVEQLRARVATLEKDLAARDAATKSRAPTFTFGESGKLPAIREADWLEMGASSKVIGDALVEMQKKVDAGEPVGRDVQIRVQQNTERVRKYEYATLDKIPTAALHNGELTHPISITNLYASMLSQAGVPLSAAQIAEFERIGVQFDEAFSKLRAGWTDGVPRVRRILEEFRLKRKMSADLLAQLTPEQRLIVDDPAWSGVAGIDLFDATLMVIHSTTAVTGATPAEIRQKMLAIVRTKAGLAEDAAAPRLDVAVDRFVEATTRSIEPVRVARVTHYTADDAERAGAATADLVDAMLRDGEGTAAAKKALLDDPRWFVPRLVAK